MLRVMGLLPVLLGVLAGCGAGEVVTPGSTSSATAAPTAIVSPAATRLPLPADFPVLPGVTEVALPADDLGVIARWTTDQVGATAYDFYSAALPAAGYLVEGRYPGDIGAIIRFVGPTGELWQVAIRELDPRTARIDVRLDRP